MAQRLPKFMHDETITVLIMKMSQYHAHYFLATFCRQISVLGKDENKAMFSAINIEKNNSITHRNRKFDVNITIPRASCLEVDERMRAQLGQLFQLPRTLTLFEHNICNCSCLYKDVCVSNGMSPSMRAC